MKIIKILPVLLLVLAMSVIPSISGTPQKLNVAEDPAEVGISGERLARVDRLMENYIADGKMVNGVVMLGKDGKIFFNKAYGWKNRESGEVLNNDDIFRIASMTKSIVLVGLMTLFEEGKFLLDDPLWHYIPEFRNMNVIDKFNSDGTYSVRAAKRPITIRHLLCHSSGIPYETAYNRDSGISFTSTMDDITIGELIKKLATMPLAHDPGEKYTYGMSVDVIGYLIEVLSGQSLDLFLEERIFKPLGMEDTYFYLPEEKKHRLVTLYSYNREGNNFIVSDNYVQQNFAIEGPQKCFLGGAGLCSTAGDYAKFCQMLLNKGTFNDNSIISPRVIEMMSTINQLAENDRPSHNFQFGLGFKIHSVSDAAHTLTSKGGYGWSGMYGTYYRVYPEENMFIVFMSNEFPWPDRDRSDELLQVTVFQSLTE
ncbi:MAG: beta-lactamase family protein [Rikenellaceae bacterium]|nr:beta-lactamase family protein [Rikenellaceae bacterium]